MQNEILGEEVEESCNKPWFKSHSGGGRRADRWDLLAISKACTQAHVYR